MIFIGVRKTKNFIVIDGYSNKKTIKGALKDLAKEVALYSKIESDQILNNIDETIGILNQNNEGTYYRIECESVSNASRLLDDAEMEYAEANYYLCICFGIYEEPDKVEPEKLKRINKNKARNLFNKNIPVYLLPCKMRLDNMWVNPHRIEHNEDENNLCQDFDTVVNYYEYYNCNDYEVGKYSAYYIKEV